MLDQTPIVKPTSVKMDTTNDSKPDIEQKRIEMFCRQANIVDSRGKTIHQDLAEKILSKKYSGSIGSATP